MAGGAPLVVVPNTELADNHQEEIAQAFEELHWVIRGDVWYVSTNCASDISILKHCEQQ